MFSFSQTSIKDLERDETCPFRWKSQWVDKLIPFKKSEDLDKGKYFEYLALGKGAIAGEDVTDLIRLKNGDKSADQIRIEAQAERFKRLFEPTDPEYLGLKIVKLQPKLVVGNRNGTLDFVAEDEDDYPWVIDLKLTKDLTSDRTKYGWGNDWENLDLLQQVHYEDLFEKEYGVRPRTGLLVFDYTPNKRVEFGEIIISDSKRISKEVRFTSAEEAFNLYEKKGWIRIPELKECENCPLPCELRLQGSKVIKKVIKY